MHFIKKDTSITLELFPTLDFHLCGFWHIYIIFWMRMSNSGNCMSLCWWWALDDFQRRTNNIHIVGRKHQSSSSTYGVSFALYLALLAIFLDFSVASFSSRALLKLFISLSMEPTSFDVVLESRSRDFVRFCNVMPPTRDLR